MPPILPAPVLTVAPDALKDLDGSDHLSGLWFVFTKCKTSLHDGRRLENISWRLWYRELASLSSYRPLTPDTPSELATKATSMPFTTPNRRTGRTGTSLPSSLGASSFHQPIGRVIYEMLPGSSPETTRVLNSKLRLPSNFPATPEAEPSIAIILPETEPTTAVSSSSSASSLALSPTFTRPPPIHPTSHSSPSLSSTSNSNHSSSGPGPLVVVVNPTPNPTPHPTPPATPVLPQTTLPASGESNHQAEVSIYGRQVQLPQQPTLSRQAGKHLLPPVQVSNISSQPPTRPPIPSSLLLPPSPTSNSNDSASSVSGSPFTAVTDTSSSTSYHDDSTLKPTDAKKFIVGMSHDRDQSSQSSESPTSSQDGYASTVGYPYHRQTVDHPQGLAKTNQKLTYTLNSGLHHPYSSETQLHHVSTQSRIQSQPKHDAHSQSQAPSHLYPQSSRSQSHSHSRSQSEAVLQQQSYVHTHAPYPSNHSLVKIRGESSASGTAAASNAFMAGGSGNGGKTGHTTSTATTTIGTTTSATSTSSTNSASGSDLRSRNRNQRLPSVPNGTVAHASMNVQQKSGGVGSHPGRRASEDSELSGSWSESESEEEEGRDKRERAANGSALSNSMDSTNASVSGKSAGSGSRLVTRGRGRTDRHSGLMMSSAKGKRKSGGGDQHTVGRKSGRQATGNHGLGMTAKPALPQTQAQGAVARGQNEVKDSYDAQGRTQANGRQKERTDSATGSVASTSGPGGPNRDMNHTELDRKKEREQTVTKKTLQMLSKGLVDQGSGLESATVAEGSSKSSQLLPHGVAAPTTTSIMPSTLAPAMTPAPYHQMSAKLAPVTSSAAPTAPCTRPKAMFNIGSHSSDGDQSKSGLSVSTGPGGSDIRSNSNEGSMSLERVPGDGVSGLARTTAYDNLRVEPMTAVPTGEKKSEKAGSSRPQSRRASDAARPSTGSSKQAQQQAAPTQLSQHPPTATATTTSNQHHAAPKPPLQQSSSRTSLPPVVGGLLPQPTTNEAIAAATALVEQNQQRQGGRRVVIDTDEDDEEEEEGAAIEEDDDDDSDYVTDEDDGDWTSDDANGDEVVPSVKGSKASSDGRATTVAAGQEKTSAAAGQKGQGHTQGQFSPAHAQRSQQQQQAVAGPSGLQRPAMHNRHLSQPNVPTVAGLAKARQQNQLQMEYDEQQKQLQAQQQQLALQQQQHQAQVRTHGLQRTTSRRERERELARQRDDINIREAVLEAQRKRDMFAKVPERSYSNLTRSKSGLLSQLMNPDPQIFPPNHPYRKGYSSGDVVSGGGAGRGVMRLGIAPMTLMGGQQGNGQQQPVARGGISAMAPPKDGGQGRGRGQGPVQPKPPVAAMSPPAMLAALKPTKSAAAPVANQVTAASVKDGGIVKGKEKEKEKESTSNGGAKYRPKGKPEDQEMETESEDEGTNALHGSVTAKEKLEKLFKTSSTGSSKQQQQTQVHQQQQQQRRPPALRQAYTEEPVRNQPMPPSPLPMQRSHSQIIPGVPLGYPYNLPPAPAPSSPRTTRQRMLREEMSESVRQNLLWHRQLSKAVVLGPRRRSSEHSGLQPLTSITTVPSIVHLERRRTPPPDTPTDQGANENGDGGVGGSGSAVSGAGAAGVAMTFHDRPVPMTRTRSWAGGGR
ncbi:hypothetical protein VKT23_004923 [Stygiomarasmius scandens]|uniref:Nitrogen regulatory protein areA GATA-like domain-containing protein n=1 Tax=Marasmiellus scandens TaxID=2682957 RepID=A0ABR1JXH1_9AGAR